MKATTRIRANLFPSIPLLFVGIAVTALHSAAGEPLGVAVAYAPSQEASELPKGQVLDFGKAPAIPTGPLKPEVKTALERAFGKNLAEEPWGEAQSEALRTLAESGDVRIAWIISDLMRIANPNLSALLGTAAAKLMQLDLKGRNNWGITTDHLIAWDVPAPPGYLEVKRTIYTLIEEKWERIFQPGDIDWRYVTWGGVLIDDRPFDTTDDPCNCIPAADNPPVIAAKDAEWLEDSDIVFGVEVNGEYRAYPRQIMEVREMINDTLGGRQLGIPYCTLCGSAQVYFTDDVPEGVDRPVLRTSGLLTRSNKVMYDLNTFSVFDTFRGEALSGPLAKKGVVLKQASVVTTEWGEWKKAHPETTVLIEALALGRDFDFRNGRDANGPIFPIGGVDPRLPVQEDIVGVLKDGQAIAFHLGTALKKLKQGEEVTFEGISLVLDAGGVRAVDSKGKDLGSHQAFWFAWSQFYASTKLWPSL